MYALTKIIADLTKEIADVAKCDMGSAQVSLAKSGLDADLMWPAFQVAKQAGISPTDLVKEIHSKVKLPQGVATASTSGGYLNLQIDWPTFAQLLVEDFSAYSPYGHQETGKGKVVVTDLSAPNIAKPFSVGHLRSTVIGDSINRHLRASAYTVIGDNHLGDWGTNFGALIVAFKKWGDREKIASSENPIKELNELYVRFHEEVRGEDTQGDGTPLEDEALFEEIQPNPLMSEARQWFRKLEQGDEEATKLWKWFTELSMKQFAKVYNLLGFSSEEALGESFYNDKMKEVVKLLEDQGYLELDETGAKIIRLDHHGVHLNLYPNGVKPGPGVEELPLLVMKGDGGTVYATRDLACALYRHRRWKPDKILYVVGQDQIDYFRQIIPVMKWLGVTAEVKHLWFGLVRMVNESGKAEKMSTRRGRVVLLEEVLSQAVERARVILDSAERPSGLTEKDKDRAARMVGIGAVKFNDLGQNRISNTTFDWDKALNLTGYSGPYLQYSAVRAKSVLKKQRPSGKVDTLLYGTEEQPLLLQLALFPQTITKVVATYEPHHMAQYLFGLAQVFSSYYDSVNILKSETAELKNARLWLVSAVGNVLKEGLSLLGIETPEQM